MKSPPPPLAVPCLLVALLLLLIAPPAAHAAQPDQADDASRTLTSPDGKIKVTLTLKPTAQGKRTPFYKVSFNGRALIDDSRLGVTLKETGGLADDVAVKDVKERQVDETWSVPVGKSSSARDHYREMVVELEERAAPHRRLDLIFRAYDDGVAFRYRFPEQPALGDFTIVEEQTHFAVAGSPRAFVLPLNSYTTPHENYYAPSSVGEITPDALAGLPLLMQHDDGTCLAIAEANLTDYAGMYLAGSPDQPGTLVTKLSPWPGQTEIKVKAKTPAVSPWRVVMIGDDAGRLIESNLILNLNEPCRIADTSWIKPGKTTLPWLNGYLLDGGDTEAPLNAATMKRYIDFCAANGIETHTLDGTEQQGGWYGGPIQPNGPTDVTTAIPALELPEVLRYAKEKGVRLRVWVHRKALEPQLEEAFAKYEEWGLEGVMLDFMDRDDQEMVAFYHEVFQRAADHHLTVNIHGAYKPTGLRRTYPNVLTREAVFNLEHNKGFRFGVPPEHNLMIPFTRMLAGPLDYHQGVLRTTTPAAFRPIWHGPEMMGTPTHQLAMYVVYENYLPMVADYPAAYEGQPGIELLGTIPVTWDETRVLNGKVGDFITIARRKGKTWYVGSMTDDTARNLELPLNFLGEGTFDADLWVDDPDAGYQPAKTVRKQRTVTSADTLTLQLAPAGGQVLRLTPR